MEKVLNKYTSRVSKFTNELSVINHYLRTTSILRFISFVSLIIFIYFFAVYENFTYLILAGLLFLVFILLIIYYLRTRTKKRFVELLLKVNENELDVIQNHNSFLDDGSLHLKQFSYSDDLDLFGQNSLFHIMNRCGTVHGKKHLTDLFINPMKSKKEISEYQDAVKDMKDKLDFRQEILAHAVNSDDDQRRSVQTLCNGLKVLLKKD